MTIDKPLGMRHVVVVGAGGNIGSHLVPHLARMPEIGRLTLIDRDSYEPRNLWNQAVTAADVARRKVAVQARVARRINQGLVIRTIAEPVEDVPLGLLRGDLILACLDSRRARQVVNEAAMRLGVPWIDAGVLGDGMLTRIATFDSIPAAPCLECAWNERDYAAVEQAYPCQGAVAPTLPTSAPATLGALAAALQAIECSRVLCDPSREMRAAVAELVVGTSPHCHYRTAHRRNAACRLGAHDNWDIPLLSLNHSTITLGALRDVLVPNGGPRGGGRLRVHGRSFTKGLTCGGCGARRATLRLSTMAPMTVPSCVRCATAMQATGMDMTDELELPALAPRDLHRTCRRIGFRAGDVLTIASAGRLRHVELDDLRSARGDSLTPAHLHMVPT